LNAYFMCLKCVRFLKSFAFVSKKLAFFCSIHFQFYLIYCSVQFLFYQFSVVYFLFYSFSAWKVFIFISELTTFGRVNQMNKIKFKETGCLSKGLQLHNRVLSFFFFVIFLSFFYTFTSARVWKFFKLLFLCNGTFMCFLIFLCK
jgi:hypothetical protein